MYILSQILVVLSDAVCIWSMLSKKKKNVIFFLLVSTILFASHYLCLKAWTGAAIGCVEIVFLILMYVLELKNKTRYNLYLSIATIIATVTLSILTWGTWISVLPMIAMVVYLVTIMFKNVVIVKSGAFVRLALNGVYMLLVKSYLGAALTIAILICTIIGIVNDSKTNKKKNDYYRQKAIKAKKLHDQGLPFVKVYAVVRDGEEFVVLKRMKNKEVSYHLSGGGVDEGETLEQAVKRELKEELNAEVDIVKELGVYDKMFVKFHLDENEFEVQYEIHVFETKLINMIDGKLGLEGEFSKNYEIARINEEMLLKEIAEFSQFGIKL